jgi:hypothetical protein
MTMTAAAEITIGADISCAGSSAADGMQLRIATQDIRDLPGMPRPHEAAAAVPEADRRG